MKIFLICAAIVLLAALLTINLYAQCPTMPDCPVHDVGMTMTGRFRTVNGHSFQLYRCPYGDEYWVRCD
jgi:hypothetical protein